MLSHRFDLLYEDDVLSALIETFDEGEQLLILNLAVATAFQGRGLGTRLMEHAEGIARALGRKSMRLYTNARFDENI